MHIIVDHRLTRLFLLTCLLLILVTSPADAQRLGEEGERRGMKFGPQGILDAYSLVSKEGFQSPNRVVPIPSAAPTAVRLPWSKLVYQSVRNLNDYNVYFANDDGSSEILLASSPGNDVQPRLNRGGTKVVFASNREVSYDIYVVDVSNTNLVRLTSYTANNQKPIWSPDGSKIAFQSYRDGNWEVYVMYADGSHQTRLTTTPGGYSGEPSWSPDGSKIAYTSYQNGGWRIWVMNADGSGQTQLSQEAYSQSPSWSPDGERIAYSCDEDSDTYYKIFTMNADGTNAQVFYAGSGYNDDVLVSGWSPDGVYILFTRVWWIFENNAWYWTDATIAMKSANTSAEPFFPNNLEWNPDWQSLDATAPQITVNSLPAVSPAPIPFYWDASDQGGSGLRGIEVQMRENPADPWVNWVKTTDPWISYPGIGGHAYYFRYRAVDNAWNATAWSGDEARKTVVENLPPISKIQPLPQYSPYIFQLDLSAEEPGGSGIKQYFVDYRDGLTGEWIYWWEMYDYQKRFYGQPGHTYYFRIRATDNAENSEVWHDPNGYDAVTTTYRFNLQGKVVDSLGLPVPDVHVNVQPAPILPGVTSSAMGTFQAPITAAGAVTATFTKTGYGILPETKYSYTLIGQVDQLTILPPVDNVVAASQFEFTHTINSPWVSDGVIKPELTSQALTGSGAVRMGVGDTFSFTPVMLSSYQNIRMVLDKQGTTHFVWSGSSGKIYYTQKPVGGVWTPAEVVAQTYNYELNLTPGESGLLYLSWIESNFSLNQRRRNLDGSWTPIINRLYPISYSNIVSDGQGIAHFVWKDSSSVFYAQQTANGIWSAPETVMANGPASMDDLKLIRNSTTGVFHLFWRSRPEPVFYYAWRSPAGIWSLPLMIGSWVNCGVMSQFVIPDNKGNIDIIWWGGGPCDDLRENYGVVMSKRLTGTGVWSNLEIVLPRDSQIYFFTIAKAPDDSLAAMWSVGAIPNLNIVSMGRSSTGVWSTPELLIDTPDYAYVSYLMFDSQGDLHLIWNDYLINLSQAKFNYWKRTANGWVKYGLITSNTSTTYPYIHSAGLDYTNHLQIATLLDISLNGQTKTWLHMGEVNIPETDGFTRLSQTVQLPAEMVHPILAFGYNLQKNSAENQGHFDVLINSGGVTTTLSSTSENTPAVAEGWAMQSHDLSAYSGQPVRIIFQLFIKKDVAAPSLLLDDVTIGTTPTDVWVESSPGGSMPGREVTYALNYGNQGSQLAVGVTLTHTLPSGMTFVSASAAVTPTGSSLVWQLGNLPGGSAGVIYLTVKLSDQAAVGANLLGDLNIRSETVDVNSANNEAQSRIFVGYSTFMVILRR